MCVCSRRACGAGGGDPMNIAGLLSLAPGSRLLTQAAGSSGGPRGANPKPFSNTYFCWLLKVY